MCVCMYVCGQSPTLFWDIFVDLGAQVVGEEERGDWNVRSCHGGATLIWGVPWRRLSWGGESCDVDVSLSAKADNLLKSNSSDDVPYVCVYVHGCANQWICLFSMCMNGFVYEFCSLRRCVPALCRCLLWFEYIQRRCCLQHSDGFKGKSTQLGPENSILI